MARTYVIGIDIGGTKIAAGLIDARTFRVLKEITVLTERARGREHILANITRAIQLVATPHTIGAIGIGSAGHVDSKKGTIHSNWSLGWGTVPIVSILKKQFRVSIYVDNDANCFTLAEATFGAALGAQTVFGITVGTGVGGGLVLNGRLHHGRNGGAGEIGHTIIKGLTPDAKRCTCGVRGHLEIYAAGSVRTKLAKKIGATKADEEIARTLAIGCANIMALLDPDYIVIGGGAGLRPGMVARIKRHVTPLLYDRQFQTTKIVKAKLGSRAGIVGAALLTR